MNLLLITGPEQRHRYFVNRLNAEFHVSTVITEHTTYPSPSPHSLEEKNAWDWFFDRRQKFEIPRMGPGSFLPTRNQPREIPIKPDQLNSNPIVQIAKQAQPDAIGVFGAGLLGPGWLRAFPGKILNLHGGIPRFFRGSSCQFWPIYEKQLNRLGASVHRVDSGIDTGAVLAEETISLEISDDEQSLGGKVWDLGIQLMINLLKTRWPGQTSTLKPQTLKAMKGRLYLRKEFTPRAVLRVKQMVESGELRKLITANLGNQGATSSTMETQ